MNYNALDEVYDLKFKIKYQERELKRLRDKEERRVKPLKEEIYNRCSGQERGE